MTTQLSPTLQAFKYLFGLDDRAIDGDIACQVSKSIAHIIQGSINPSPLLSQLVHSVSFPPAPFPRYIDVDTGMRLKYLDFNPGGEDVILLLHDIGEASEIWIPIANQLADRGYRVIALDARGHGDSSWASKQIHAYTAKIMSQDIKAFITAKDLYVRPVALVGCGMGAAIALQLASDNPKLIGSLIVAEFSIHHSNSERCSHGGGDSRSVAPWHSLRVGQGVAFASLEHYAAFLLHPLVNIGPSVYPLLLKKVLRPDEKDSINVNSLNRDPRSVVYAAKCMMRSTGEEQEFIDDLPSISLKMDPHFCFSYENIDVGSLGHHLHVLLLHGEKSTWVSDHDLHAMDIQGAIIEAVSGGGHWLVSDNSRELGKHITEFLEGCAVNSFEIQGSTDQRRPEILNLKPLPEYATLEEAQRALGPRAIPTPLGIQEELQKLRLESGYDSGEEEEEDSINNGNQTALAKESPDYFGFVG